MPKERVIKIVRLSFDPAYEDDPTPHVVIYNPEMLTPAAFSQVTRFGIGHSLDRKAIMSGKLKGGRRALTEMIQSYGFTVEVVDVPVG